jgi:hypothetical protein
MACGRTAKASRLSTDRDGARAPKTDEESPSSAASSSQASLAEARSSCSTSCAALQRPRLHRAQPCEDIGPRRFAHGPSRKHPTNGRGGYGSASHASIELLQVEILVSLREASRCLSDVNICDFIVREQRDDHVIAWRSGSLVVVHDLLPGGEDQGSARHRVTVCKSWTSRAFQLHAIAGSGIPRPCCKAFCSRA